MSREEGQNPGPLPPLATPPPPHPTPFVPSSLPCSVLFGTWPQPKALAGWMRCRQSSTFTQSLRMWGGVLQARSALNLDRNPLFLLQASSASECRCSQKSGAWHSAASLQPPNPRQQAALDLEAVHAGAVGHVQLGHNCQPSCWGRFWPHLSTHFILWYPFCTSPTSSSLTHATEHPLGMTACTHFGCQSRS